MSGAGANATAPKPDTGRSEQLASAFASSLGRHPLLCDLISAQASVLERNVSTKAVLEFKHASHADLAEIVGLLLDHLPELGRQDATQVARVLAGLLRVARV